MSTAQTTANRANAQHSTGPTTPEGKASSSRNAFRHGLASGQIIIPGEDPAAYDALLQDLTREHAPATVTEQLLVTQMAQNFWFMQRCIRLHQDAFARVDMSKQVPITSMPLLVRYESSANRGFHKALSTLLTLQKARKAQPVEPTPQPQEAPAAQAGFVSPTDPPPASPAPAAPPKSPQRPIDNYLKRKFTTLYEDLEADPHPLDPTS